MPAHRDLSGHIFRGITVISVAHIDQRHEYYYHCRCHCGAPHIFSTSNLKNPRIKGCGCLNEAAKHGRVNTPEYRTWAAMKARCYNPKVRAFPDYGGRGITVCPRWQNFRQFYEDMGNKPSPRHSIERRDNSLGYSPENCYWATAKEQANNRRPRRKKIMDH